MRDHLGNAQVGAKLGFARGVLLLDDCEGTFTWAKSGTGGDDVAERAAAAAFEGVYGIHIRTRTTGAAAGDGLDLSRIVGFGESGQLVYRMQLCLPDVSVVSVVRMEVYVYDGANMYLGTIRLTPNTPRFEYFSSVPAFTEIPSLALLVNDGQWFTIEMVLNVLSGEFITVTFNGVTADLAGVGMFDAGATTDRYLMVWFGLDTIGAAPAAMYVDNVSLTEFRDL